MPSDAGISFRLMEEFTPTDAHAAHAAMIDMREAARKYQERKPSSSTGEAMGKEGAGAKGRAPYP
jgi:hypothetical protein